MRKRRKFARMTPHASRLFFLLVLCCLASCTDKPKNSREQAAPVLTARVAQKVLPVQVEAIGHVEASATVTVKSQIGGMLQQVAFTAGQDVRKGDLLFKIDPRPQQTALQQAQGNLERDLARMRNAQADARRYQQLFRQGYVSRQQYELSDAEAKALQANVAADRAAVESARVQLEYCTIRSPLTGRTGDLLIDRGNVIKAIDENLALVTINQLRPIYVRFTVPEHYLPQIAHHMAQKKNALEIQAFAEKDANTPLATGKLTFVDNHVDLGSGTVLLKGTFENADLRLWPGQFVHVKLILTHEAALVVPSHAVQAGQQGEYSYVVTPQLTVEARPVKVDRSVGAESIIAQGLAEGEQVVIEGQMRLSPGAKVELRSVNAPPQTQRQEGGQAKEQS